MQTQSATEEESFLQKFDGLVVGQASLSHYALVHMGSEQVYDTWLAPGLPQLDIITNRISTVVEDLPSGSHTISLRAIATNGVQWGVLTKRVTGRNQTMRQAISDAGKMAEALAMNVETAQAQIERMEARAQASDKRAAFAEEQVGKIMVERVQMVDMVHKMMMDREEAAIGKAESEKRMEILGGIATMFAPILNELAQTGAEAWRHKAALWKIQREKEEREAAEAAQKPTPPAAPAEPKTEEKTDEPAANEPEK